MNWGTSNRSWNFSRLIKNMIFIKRHTSTSPMTKIMFISTGTAALLFGLQVYVGNEKIWKNYVMPVMHKIDPERAHRISIKLASFGIVPYILPDTKEMESFLVKKSEINMIIN